MRTSTQPGPVELRAKQTSLARATQALKERWARERKQNGQLLAMAQRDQAIRERPATKKDAKCLKLTHGTRNSFNAETLRLCPGGGVRGNRFTTINILRMGDSVLTPETGCRLATKAEQRRLQHSARNANTTCGNYSATATH